MKQPLEQTLSGLQLGYDLGGNVEVPTRNSKATASTTLPISWSHFLQGVAVHNYPMNSFEVDSIGILCTETEVTLSARCLSAGGNTGVRYVVFGY